MSDFNTRGKIPFTVVSSSVKTGYAAGLTASVGQNIDIVDLHRDDYGEIKGSPAQGPFTNQHVGGNQHRHIALNSGSDNAGNRAEAFKISSSAGSVRVYGPEIGSVNNPVASLTRDNTAKSPVNIKNIRTAGNIAGNFENNYQVVQSVGRRTTNNLINDGFEASGTLTTKFVSGSHEVYTLPDITNNSKSIFVERFNAPGGKEESSRGRLDREGEEFSPNNSLTTRNIKVRQPFYNQLTQHAAQFNSGSTNKLLPDTGTVDAVTIHGVNRNTIEKVLTYDEVVGIFEQQVLSGSLAIDENDFFGLSVAINSAGDRVVVGGWWDEGVGRSGSSGTAYIFVSGATGWIEQVVLSGSLAAEANDYFGHSVAMNSTGDRVIIGAYQDEGVGLSGSSGAAYIFVSGTTGWIEQVVLSGSLATGSNDNFGSAVSMNSAGDRIVVGAKNDEGDGASSNSGTAYIFVSGTTGWIEQQILSGSLATDTGDGFGVSVSMNSAGDRVIIGAEQDEGVDQPTSSGTAYIFVSGATGWAQQQILSGSLAADSDLFGCSVAMNSAGDRVVVGAQEAEGPGLPLASGKAYVYVSGAIGWTEQHILYGSLAIGDGDNFGKVVSMNSAGDRIVVGAQNDEGVGRSGSSGTAYIFVSGTTGWFERSVVTGSLATESNDNFGQSVAMNSTGDRFAIGAYQDEGVGRSGSSGTAYIFQENSYTPPTEDLTRHDNFWVQHSIPSTDLRYKWIADSISSEQQPIQYQSYNLPYSTDSTYNSNGAFSDLEFEQVGPFGDHLGISGAIDKDEMHVSTYTNTMYRDRKYLQFTASNDCYIDASSIAQEISEKDFSVSFWVSFPSNASNGEKTLLVYSGSSTQNELVLNTSSSLGALTISGSQTTTEYQLSSSLLDNSWHLVTMTSDVTKRTRRLTTVAGSTITTTSYPTVTKIYVDAGLVSEIYQPNKIFNLSAMSLSVGRGSELQGGRLDEVYLWNKVLTEQEITEVFRTTKSAYGKQPKKYVEHKLDNSNVPAPTHGYSSDVEKNTNTLIDLIGGKNLALVNFTSSVNIGPQNSGIVSYSTYFNGPYEGASWKSIRNAEHPVTRKLATENTNVVSVLIPEGPKKVARTVRGNPIIIQLPGSRKQGQLLNIKESPVYANNKPLKHRFILKDSQDPNIAIETIHTYANNLQYFANQELNDTLGLQKTDRQMYNILYDYYSGKVEDVENPIQKLVGFTYSETIFPKPGTALLRETRQRTDYITDEPGFGIDGYDRQLGTQRVFWRDNQEDRMRSRNYITSFGQQYSTAYTNLPYKTPSISALESIGTVPLFEWFNVIPGLTSSYSDNYNLFGGELNTIRIFKTHWKTGKHIYFFEPVLETPEIFFNKSSPPVRSNVITYDSATYPLANLDDPYSLLVTPRFTYEHTMYMTSSSGLYFGYEKYYSDFTYDLGLNRFTEALSNKNRWYDSYEDYCVDVKSLANDTMINYSKIPEFKISERISSLSGEYAGDQTKITLNDYIDSLQFNYKKSLGIQNQEIADEDTITITVDGVKKLLPYNGFYPQDRSMQLVNYLKESYIDTSAIGGGLLIIDIAGGGLEYEFKDEEDKLADFLKKASFLEPLYSPGIFYNLIKSGIAVDWTVFTGSLPDAEYVTLNKAPDFRIPFEAILDLTGIPFSEIETGANSIGRSRILKYKSRQRYRDASDYGLSTVAYFQGFFEKIKNGSPVYSLSINNFLAESINFFLKDSTLNTFISKPDSDFLSFDSNKTYYMDIVLRKNDIVMCQAHSSSLADNFGKMTGRYFGPSVWTGSDGEALEVIVNNKQFKILQDPSYCAYTPPYYYGDSRARISFKPSLTRKYTLDEIFEEMQIQFYNTGFIDDSVYTSGSYYSSYVMPLESSVKIKGQIESRQQTVQLENLSQDFSNSINRNLRKLVGTATNSTGVKKWVISPKMEVPVLDFTNQSYITSSTSLQPSTTDLIIKAIEPLHTPPTASGFGRGMWSGYGEIPTGDKGIFLELRESHPRQLVRVLDPATRQFVESNTGSLLQACGFQATNDKLSKKIGELADSREISEAIIIIPYLDKASTGKSIRFGGGFSTLKVNDTVEIEGHNFIKINQNIFNYQKTNVLANKPAVSLADFSRGVGSVQETSISRMIGLMDKYVLPPNFDFLLNDSVTPFVMYIAEFTSNLDKQDLADIWQGVMPKIAMRAEREKTVVSHKNTQFDFFHGQGLPEDVKFMIFKAKKRAEINYYKMTADSSDDGLFPSIEAGKPPSPYSFNWPYDYCSLVETARVDVEIEYVNKSGSNST